MLLIAVEDTLLYVLAVECDSVVIVLQVYVCL